MSAVTRPSQTNAARPRLVLERGGQTPGSFPPATELQPLDRAHRIPLLDLVRGLAMLGGLFGDPRFLILFAALFGFGTAKVWGRVSGRGGNPLPVHLRRMLFLLAIGLVHAAVARNGNILAPYAVLGLGLPLLRKAPVWMLLLGAAVLGFLSFGVPASWYLTDPLLTWPRILALMLGGVAMERAHFVWRLVAQYGVAQWMLGLALFAALAARVGLQLLGSRWTGPELTLTHQIVLDQLDFLGAVALAAVIFAAAALVCWREAWLTRLFWLRAVGQLAFTNYLIQAALIVSLGLFFGWPGRVSPTGGLAVALGVAALQIPFSVWWTRRFFYGPVEWVWRAVTYQTRPRLRIGRNR